MAVIKLDGGYNSLPISYKRGNPIPLDKSSVWYDYDLMMEYAATNGTAYVGQILSLVNAEDNSAKAYIILNQSGDLEEIGTGALISGIGDRLGDVETQISDIQLILNSVGAPADEDSEATGLFAEIAKKANAEDVYTKQETISKIEAEVAKASHLKRKEVGSIDEIDLDAPDADEYVYMVPSGLSNEDNKYYEYLVMEIEIADDEGVVTKVKKVERVGSWEVNLNDYAKLTDLTTESNRAKDAEDALGERLSALERKDETNDSRFENIDKDIEDLNNNKVDKSWYNVENEDGTISKVEGTLLTPEEKKKLSALVIDENGSVGVSGYVNVSKVQGLEEWMKDEAHKHLASLDEDNLSADTVNKINFITTVDTTSFTVSNGNLSLNDISINKVSGLQNVVTKVGTLEDAINAEETGLNALHGRLSTIEGTYVTQDTFNTAVGNLNDLLTNKAKDLSDRIDLLDQRMSWQDLDN